MKSKTSHPNSSEKRATLKRLKAVGIGSAAVTALGMSGWVKPVVNQIVLPAHASLSPTCSGIQIVAIMGRCSSGAPVDIEISTVDGLPMRILSVPTISATPTTTAHASGDWKTVSGGAVPADITDIAVYNAVTKGQVMDENICSTPATGVPNDPTQQPLTRLDLTVEVMCLLDNTTSSITVDILPQITA